MTDRRLLVSVAAVAMATALAGCERAPYPAPSQMAGPPPATDTPDLMGAPEGKRDAGPESLQPAPERPGDAPVPSPAPDAYPPSATAAPYASPGPPLAPAPPRIVTMEPIPNPPEPTPSARPSVHRHETRSRTHAVASGRREHRSSHAEGRRHARVHRRLETATPAGRPDAAPPPKKVAPKAATASRTHIAPVPVQQKPSARSALPVPAAATSQSKSTAQSRPVVPSKPVQVVKPAPVLTKPTLPTVMPHAKTDVASGETSHAKHGRKESVTARTPSAARSAETAAKLSAMSAALGPVIASRASLKGVDGLKPGAPVDVSLSVPPDFADGLRSEAQRAGLSDSAASAAITAKLSGPGYAVSPTEPQTQPLMSGKATDFRWTVTKTDAARAPLQAEIGADLLGGGKQHLDFGAITAKTPPGFKISPRALGLGLLLLVAALAAMLLTGGRRPRRTAPPGPERRL